ncbi:hypothetical protein C0J52_22775 [Blattella germanica]|nr:hypothetical protein C0J52_22775 [Blattella germanica]
MKKIVCNVWKMLLVLCGLCLLPSLLAMTEYYWVTAEDQTDIMHPCDCLNTTEHHEVIIDCRCAGSGLTDVPKDLDPGLHTL